ncbi:tetratricopeptide repeat-containing protein [Mycena galericulata]|nr:tetratricopeptide repeat-containing protein [Mycena galericulata]
MEDTTILSSDHESMAWDTQGIVASMFPNNEAVITTPSAEDVASKYFKMAHDLFLEYKAAGNISSLNTAIDLLECAASGWPPQDTEFSDCLNHLATALLIRLLSYVVEAWELRFKDFYNPRHEDVTSKEMMTGAVRMLKEFLQAHNQVTLETAILLYQEGLKLTAETHFQWWRVLWELSDALLIQFHHTGNPSQVHEAISFLKQVQKAKVNRSICLFAALITGHEGILGLLNQAEVTGLSHKVVQNNKKALDMMQLGQDFWELFKTHHNSIHLEAAMKNWREAELLLSWGHESRGRLLNLLAAAVRTKFEQQGDPRDIDEAITLHREALEICASPHPEWSDPKDIDEAITLHRTALEIFAPPHPLQGSYLNNLAIAIYTRFERQGDPEDIDEAITLHRQALEIRAPPHPLRASSLNNLANAVGTRFKLQGDPKDIDEAIILHREALEIRATTYQDRGGSLNNLANAVRIRFERLGDPKDIDEAIILHRKALEIRDPPHPLRSSSLNNLANAVQTRFQLQGDPKDIDEAITLRRAALEIWPTHHPEQDISLNNLATAFQTRFELHGDPKDIDEAITLQREALETFSPPHPERGTSLNNLATAVQTRFEQRGDPKDIDETITLHREALEIRAPPHPLHSISLNNLGTALQTWFQQQGDPNDIDEAIALHRTALEIHASPHPRRGGSLNNLSSALQTRFERQVDPKDIDEAITLHREALEICAAPHPLWGSALNNLATAVQTRFYQWGDLKDIDEAITLHREALEIRGPPHPLRSSSLNNLANAIRTRFQQWGDPKDIDEAITLHRAALEICGPPHPERGISLNNLATAVHTRFEQKCGDPKDIDEAIALHREALQIHAEPHPRRGGSLNNLSSALQTRFEQQVDPKDLDEAITFHREASIYLYSSPLTRFSASHQWIRSATKHGLPSLVDAYRTAINLLPQLAAFSLDLKSRQQMLASKDIVSLASASATCAIGLNKNNVAVEFLEASRSIFWAQALQLRTPVDKLENVNPELSTKLRHLSQQLEQASFRDISQHISMNTQHHLKSIEAVAAQCRKLNAEWDETVNAVREVTGFEDFLQPKSIASLCQAAASGPIIILLASGSACSALIVNSAVGIQPVPLPRLKVETVEHYADLPRALSGRTFNPNNFLEDHGHEEPYTQQSDLSARFYGEQAGHVNMSLNDIFRRHLAEIWQEVVKPVFEVLNLKVVASSFYFTSL